MLRSTFPQSARRDTQHRSYDPEGHKVVAVGDLLSDRRRCTSAAVQQSKRWRRAVGTRHAVVARREQLVGDPLIVA